METDETLTHQPQLVAAIPATCTGACVGATSRYRMATSFIGTKRSRTRRSQRRAPFKEAPFISGTPCPDMYAHSWPTTSSERRFFILLSFAYCFSSFLCRNFRLVEPPVIFNGVCMNATFSRRRGADKPVCLGPLTCRHANEDRRARQKKRYWNWKSLTWSLFSGFLHRATRRQNKGRSESSRAWRISQHVRVLTLTPSSVPVNVRLKRKQLKFSLDPNFNFRSLPRH